MLQLAKEGAYSDITVIFNKIGYKLHILLLAKTSKYFDCVYKNNFNDKKTIEITFEQVDGKLLDSKYFGIWVNSVYDDTYCIDDIMKQSSIIQVVEFHRLLDYLQCDGIEKYELTNIIEKKLNDVKSISNDMDKFMIEYSKNVRIAYCGSCYYNINNNLPSTFGLGTDFYQQDELMTYDYIEYLFKLVTNDKHKKIIIGISNVQLQDIYKFDIKYHKLILKIIMNRIK